MLVFNTSEKPNYFIVASTALFLCICYYLYELFYGEIYETHSGQTLVERAFLIGLVTAVIFIVFEAAFKHIFFSPSFEGMISWHLGQSLAAGLVSFVIDSYFDGYPTWESKHLFAFISVYALCCFPGILIGYLIHHKTRKNSFDEDLRFIIVRSSGKEDELVVDPRDVMFLAEEDTSMRVFYLENGEINSKLIASKLSNFEKEFRDIPFLLRAHKAYIVNINRVSEVVREKQQILLHFSSHFIIPVEEKFRARILNRIN
ncbi:MAG: LytTR family transcriptional regulator DNA-binding domain-containing protein [Cyclobacteriaceae bacterium]